MRLLPTNAFRDSIRSMNPSSIFSQFNTPSNALRLLAALLLLLFTLWQLIAGLILPLRDTPIGDMNHLAQHWIGQSHHHHQQYTHIDDSQASLEHMSQGGHNLADLTHPPEFYPPATQAPLVATEPDSRWELIQQSIYRPPRA